MTSTLSRYLLRRTGLRAVVLLVLFLAVLVGGQAAVLGGRGAPLESLLPALPTLIMLSLPLALPLALSTAVLVVLSGMRRDGELRALAAAGIGQGAVVLRLWPLFLVGLLAAGLLWHQLMPQAVGGMRENMKRTAEVAFANRVHRQKPLYDRDGCQAWAGGIEGGELRDFFIRENRDGVESLLFAERAWPAVQDGGVRLRLAHPVLVRLLAGEDDLMIVRTAEPFAGTHAVPFPDAFLTGMKEPDALPTAEVRRLVDAGPGSTSDERKRYNNARLTWQLRWYVPVALVLFCLFAAGLAMIAGAAENLAGVVIVTLVVSAATYPAMGYVKSGAAREMADPGWLLWPPGLVLGAMGVALILRADRAYELMERARARLARLLRRRPAP